LKKDSIFRKGNCVDYKWGTVNITYEGEKKLIIILSSICQFVLAMKDAILSNVIKKNTIEQDLW